jgi:disulfide oxidoreductase YuzD
MTKSNKKEINWLSDVEAHDYPAAVSYLSIIYNPDKVEQLVVALKASAIVQFKAKDIFRASKLSLLGVSNSHVQKDSKKIRKDIALSPLLLVRDELNGLVIIADGYHRLCAIYEFDEDAMIFCKIV